MACPFFEINTINIQTQIMISLFSGLIGAIFASFLSGAIQNYMNIKVENRTKIREYHAALTALHLLAINKKNLVKEHDIIATGEIQKWAECYYIFRKNNLICTKITELRPIYKEIKNTMAAAEHSPQINEYIKDATEIYDAICEEIEKKYNNSLISKIKQLPCEKD